MNLTYGIQQGHIVKVLLEIFMAKAIYTEEKRSKQLILNFSL